jgi:uncharacterized coiled-coil DUF342 family protein
MSEKTLDNLKTERDKINSEVQELISEGKKFSKEIKSTHKEIDDIKASKKIVTNKANAFNRHKLKLKKEIKEFKKRLSSINKEKDSSISSKGGLKNIEKKYKRLNWILQTEVMNPQIEDRLSKEVRELEVKLENASFLKKIRKEQDEIDSKMSPLANDLNIISDLIFDINQDSGDLHAKIIKKYNNLKKIHTHLEPISKKIEEKKKEANMIHKKYLDEKEKTLSEEDKKKLQDKRQKAEKVKKNKEKEKETFEQTIEDLKKGKKISLDDLALFQK